MNDYSQLLSLITGGQQTPADRQAPAQPDWLQWLLQNRQQPGGGTAAGGKSGMSGMGSALMQLMGGGAAGGMAAGGMGGMLGGL